MLSLSSFVRNDDTMSMSERALSFLNKKIVKARAAKKRCLSGKAVVIR